MLLRVRVANVRSLRDEQELSFVAPPDSRETDGSQARERTLSDGKTVDVYPLLGVFGANASGKSNVIAALRSMRHAVLNSYAEWTAHEGIPRDTFAFDSKATTESSFFEADIVLEDRVRYTYGFELGPKRIVGEWLHAYPKGRRQVWFDRDVTRTDDPLQFPGNRVTGGARLRETTRPNALLLSRAATDNHPQLSRVYRWFRDNLWDVTPETERAQREAFTARALRDPTSRARVEELLRVADLGIEGTEVDRDERGNEIIRFRHTAADAETSGMLDWAKESFGTRSWFALLGPMLHALDEGAVLLVDELDSSLHPRFAAEVIRLFESPRANPRDAQLVFTAHDPSLMRGTAGRRLLDPGQIWLTEKDAAGATRLYPITDLDPTDEEDLMDSYLAGSFGAVPRVIEGQVARRLERARAVEVGAERA